MTAPQPDFDPIARPYRWLEYLTLGPVLQSCRLHFLPHLRDRSQALVLGDGDGRFLARLLAQNPNLHADAVDISATMLTLLRQRCQSAATRLQTHHTDALTFLASVTPVRYDIVVTHFFLDCLTQHELTRLTITIAPLLRPGALWLISDFRIPSGVMRLPATLLVRSLYLTFRIFTGLNVTHLPDHTTALSAAGLRLKAQHLSLFGLLTTELWTAPEPTSERSALDPMPPL